MIRRIELVLIALVTLLGLAWAQPTLHVSPSLQFDDTAFNYHMSDGYLHFRRDIVENTLYIRLDANPEPDGIAVAFQRDLLPTDSWFPKVAARNLLGIELTRHSIELPIAATDTVAVMDAFIDMLPSIGFVSELQMMAGNTYVYRCGCSEIADTSLRLSFTPIGETIFVRMVLHTPYAF